MLYILYGTFVELFSIKGLIYTKRVHLYTMWCS
jgi:hypothetical protein